MQSLKALLKGDHRNEIVPGLDSAFKGSLHIAGTGWTQDTNKGIATKLVSQCRVKSRKLALQFYYILPL